MSHVESITSLLVQPWRVKKVSNHHGHVQSVVDQLAVHLLNLSIKVVFDFKKLCSTYMSRFSFSLGTEALLKICHFLLQLELAKTSHSEDYLPNCTVQVRPWVQVGESRRGPGAFATGRRGAARGRS